MAVALEGVVTVCDKSVKYGYIRVYTRGLFMRHYRPGIKAGRLLKYKRFRK